eukprot:gene13716-16170_t
MNVPKESWVPTTPASYLEKYDKLQESSQFTVRYGLIAMDMATGTGPIDTPLKCLDVGCGMGALSLPLAERVCQVPGSSVTSVDFSKDMIDIITKRAAEKKLTLNIQEMDGMNLTLPSNEFDRVFSISALIFFPDRAKGLSEIHRVLKPGGSAYIQAWEPHFFSTIAARAAYKLADPNAVYPEAMGNVLTFGESVQFEKAFLEAGFSSAKIHDITLDYEFDVEDMVQFFIWNPMIQTIGRSLPEDKYPIFEKEFCRVLSLNQGKVTITGVIGIGTK